MLLFVIGAFTLFGSLVATLAYVLGFKGAELTRRMRKATTYTDWQKMAEEYDRCRGYDDWKDTNDMRLFNAPEVRRRIDTLRTHIANGQAGALLRDLQYDFHRAMCGMHNPPLYTSYRSGTKTLIRELVEVICQACEFIGQSPDVLTADKHNEILHILRAYGQSALVLNSSAALGTYQVGVVKALWDAKILPQVLCGSGSGALVAAMACCSPDLDRMFRIEQIDFNAFASRGKTGALGRKLRRLWNEGTLMDVSVLLQFAKDNVGEITFREAFERTGRVLNINVEVFHPDTKCSASWLINYLTGPDVLVYTAAVASCATPGVYSPVDILQRMPDGTVVKCEPATLKWSSSVHGFHPNDAVERMRSLFGVSNFIVAEASLLRLPFFTVEGAGFPLSAVGFITEEFWRLVAAVSRIPAFQSRLTPELQSMCVPLEADVVLHPVSSPADLLRLLTNPDQKLLDYCIHRGELQVWPHLKRLKSHIDIERALRDLYSKVPPSGAV